MTEQRAFKDDLPVGWATAPVAELCDLVRGVSYVKGEESNTPKNGYIPLLRANNINGHIVFNDLRYVPPRRVSPDQMLRSGDVVVAMSSGSKAVVGKTAMLDHEWEGTFGAFCGVLRPCTGLDSRYFGLFFQTEEYRDFMSDVSAGVNINNLKRDHFALISLPIPPVAEQRRIANHIGKLLARCDSARDHLSRVPVILKRFRQAVLSAACSGRLTEDWREPRVQEQTWNNSSALPDSWQFRTLAEIISEPLANGRSVPDATVGFPVLRLTALRNGRVDLNERKIGAWTAKEASRFLVRRNDFLVSRGNGSLALVGRGGLVDSDPDPVAYPDTLIRIRTTNAVNVRYLTLLWNSRVIRDQIESLAHTTAGIHKVSQKDLAVVNLPIPPPSEQGEIVVRVESLFGFADCIERQVMAATTRTDRLTQSILSKAFRGELVLTEDELAKREGRDYEPASALLNRIKKESLTAAKSSRVKRK
jgi:type I restriction enzyme, S subunit